MNDETATRRRPRLRRLVLSLLLLFFAVLGTGASVLYLGVSAALRAEENLHSTLFTIRLVEQFVHEKGRWPSSWNELEELPFPSDAPSPLNGKLSVVRIGGQHGFAWPEQAEFLKEHVAIDFQPDLKLVATQQPTDFEAIKPIGAYYEYRDYGFVQSLQETLARTAAAEGREEHPD